MISSLISYRHKKVSKILSYIERLLFFASTVTRYISISAITSLVGILIGIKSFAWAVKICTRTAIISISQ